MDIKDYLKTISKREHEIECMKGHLEVLRSMAEGGSSPQMDDMPHSSGLIRSSMENFVCKAIDLEEKIREMEEELESNKMTIIDALESLPSREESEVILERYFRHLSWNEIASRMSLSMSSVFKLHGVALAGLRQRLEVVA